MSVEAVKAEETTPVVPKTEQTSGTPLVSETPTHAATTVAPSTSPTTDAPAPVMGGSQEGETAVEAVPASEGVLGYKAPGFLKQFHFSKHHFWFSDEAVPTNNLHGVREKHGSEHAAWARETGKGALFFSKRAEDKGTPGGMILLHESSDVAKEGFNIFSVKVGDKIHKFEASTAKERDSWIVALEKKLEEAKTMKNEITGKDSYKKNMEDYAKPTLVSTGAAPAIKKDRSKSKEPKKSLDATPATDSATTPAVVSATDGAADETATPVEQKRGNGKERSQSRKRTSIFGSLLPKKDEQKTELKKEEKAEKKAEKEVVKEEKKAEAEQKKEEAKQTHDTSKATKAAEAATVAAVPTAIIASDKKEDEEKTGTTTPTDKRAKRASVFGSLFQKKNVTSPSAEKTEAEAFTPLKDTEVAPVSETAPKIDEPIDTKPLDAAAVTAPVDAAVEPTTDDATKGTTPNPATESHKLEKTEKKPNFLSGLIKKVEGKKEESHEGKPVETTTTNGISPTTDGMNEAAAETPVAKEERPAREKRRSSLFGTLGTLKKKPEQKDEAVEATSPTTGTEAKRVNGADNKREKSPLPNKIGGLFRRASQAMKSDTPKKSTATESATNATPTTDTTPAEVGPMDTSATEVTGPAAGSEATDTKIVGDVVPEAIYAQTADKVATAPEVKASA